MTYTYDPATAIGKVRRSIPDRIESECIWTDEELQSFLDDEGDFRRATAAALEAIASDQALVLKVIKLGNLSTDGAKTSDALLARAARLRSQAEEADASDGAAFDWAEQVVDSFSARERIRAQALRGAL